MNTANEDTATIAVDTEMDAGSLWMAARNEAETPHTPTEAKTLPATKPTQR